MLAYRQETDFFALMAGGEAKKRVSFKLGSFDMCINRGICPLFPSTISSPASYICLTCSFFSEIVF